MLQRVVSGPCGGSGLVADILLEEKNSIKQRIVDIEIVDNLEFKSCIVRDS